eukprot:816929-Rhodomonas_salina.2
MVAGCTACVGQYRASHTAYRMPRIPGKISVPDARSKGIELIGECVSGTSTRRRSVPDMA